LWSASAEKLLERMQQSTDGWRRTDLDRLYHGFGFELRHGGKHDVVKHPRHPELRATLPRHTDIAKGYVSFAVHLIERLKQLEQ
jgi:hypothetical protein